MLKRRIAILCASVLPLVCASAASAQERPEDGTPRLKHAIEFSPISPVIRIYAAQYARRVGEKNELLFGLAYANIKYDHGRSHAPTVIVGYRRYVWRKAHIEYQLWPSYNWYYETDERRYYNGAELWNEFRPGYTFDFHMGRTPVFLNFQYLIGFGLYGDGSKPQSWKDQAERDGEVFAMPVVFMGWRF